MPLGFTLTFYDGFMKTDFVQPCFVGQRFDEHTLPLEVASDLVAYEALVVELAKHLYILDHPARQRVPRGFVGDFQLHLGRIDSGSAKPMLAWVTAGALALTGGSSSYFDRARDLVAECIASPDGALPAKFAKELLTHFNQLGRSLREGESLELPRVGASSAKLTPDRRKRLVLAADQVYEREVKLEGLVGQVDWDNSTFRMRLTTGGQMTIPMADSFHDKARQVGGKNRSQVVVTGVGAFDSWERLQKVVSVDAIDVQPNYAIAARFRELAILEDGWCDGQGTAPDKDLLSLLSESLTSFYPETLPLPLIAPTQDGNVLLEWNTRGDPSVDIELADKLVADFHAFSDGRDIERRFELDGDESWALFFEFLGIRIENSTT